MKNVVDIITMGCSKNLVDSEHLIFQLSQIGYEAYSNPEEIHGGIAVVNTCGFIEQAKEESINMILELCEAKKEGRLERVYVMGCLSQRYRRQLEEEIPQVDKFFGKFDWKSMISLLKQNNRQSALTTCNAGTEKGILSGGGRVVTTPHHYAYIKISEGCDRRCAYCAIPLITGHQVSRTIEDISAEVETLAKSGVKEFQIIAQDSTSYGTDIYGKKALPELIESLAEINGVEWIRVHYAYPNNFPMQLLKVMREHPNVCKYLDIALQHIDDKVLQKMHRNITGAETRDLIRAIREEVPGIALRTTMMVGFPGESEAAFNRLMDFVEEARFEHLGTFAYSEEEGTYAAIHYKDSIAEHTKQDRLDRVMELQQRISEEICESRVGNILRVIIDRQEGGYFIGRTQYDSPEVDGEVLIEASKMPEIKIGEFYDVKVTSSNEYDLIAEPTN